MLLKSAGIQCICAKIVDIVYDNCSTVCDNITCGGNYSIYTVSKGVQVLSNFITSTSVVKYLAVKNINIR